jgi:SAM-dependent methyltransferase
LARTWNFVDARGEERALFQSLAATLALPAAPATPPNRFRQVRRIEAGGGTWFLKCFWRTQWKNRARNALTAPRCRLDAERELAVARALRERGFATARCVAVGTDGPASFYLCAALPGRSLRQLLEAGAPSSTLADAAARHLGAVARAGVALPDLSLEHVFALDGGGFALIDLHNGGERRPGRRDAARWLRHLARSARGLALPPRLALRFAARLLRAAGLRAHTRGLLRALPPLATHARYDAPGKAAAYRTRNPERDRRERALLARVWPGRPGELVLDSPCGAGRLRAWVEGEGRGRWVACDRSPAMLREAAAPGRVALADAATLPLAARSIDGVVVFRFLHHLDDAQAREVLAEAARVARGWLVFTFFHPASAHALARSLACRLRARAPTRHARTLRWHERVLAEHGFARLRHAAEAPFRRELWAAAFTRR